MNADGSGAEIVAEAGANQENYTPRFAPFGSRILFNQVTYDGNNVASAELLLIYPHRCDQEHHA